MFSTRYADLQIDKRDLPMFGIDVHAVLRILLVCWQLVGCEQINDEVYSLSREELTAFSGLKHNAQGDIISHDNHISEASRNASPNSPDYKFLVGGRKANFRQIDTHSLCPEHNYRDVFGFMRTHTFSRARCENKKWGRPRRFLLTCHQRSVRWPYFNSTMIRSERFWHSCPKGTTCQDYGFPILSTRGRYQSARYEDIECVPDKLVKIDNLAGVAARPSLHGPFVHKTSGSSGS